MGASYIEVRSCEFTELTQGDKIVVEYKAKFLRLSRYARGLVATNYDKSIRFEVGMR